MADANIFQQYLRPVRSVAEYAADYDKKEANALELAALRQKAVETQRANADDMAARSAYQQAAGDPKAYRNALVRAGNYRAVQALDDAELKRAQAVAETGLKTAQTGKATADAAESNQKLFKDSLGAVVANPTPETVEAVLAQLEATTGRSSAQARQIFATARTPEDIRNLAMRIGVSLEKQLPSTGNVDLGGNRAFTATDPLTGRVTITGQAPITQSADNAATNATSRANNSATNATTMRGQDLVSARAKDALASKISPKPLPAGALKMQQESLDAIGTASAINSDLSAIETQIAGGKLTFGPVSNLTSAARNAAGMSNENSRNLASFKTNLEKLRNDSLRLNKGVQTDGDAQRAWNELFQNINDTELVKQRLGEIKRLNDRAVQLRKLDIDTVRSNYNQEPLSTDAYSDQPASLNGGNRGGGQSATPTRQGGNVIDFGSLR